MLPLRTFLVEDWLYGDNGGTLTYAQVNPEGIDDELGKLNIE